MRKRLIVWASLLVSAFLIGFIPQWLLVNRQRIRIERLERQLASAQIDRRLSDIRDMAAMTYVKTVEKNYSIAGDYATRMFDRIREIVYGISRPADRSSFERILALRDCLIRALAQANPQSAAEFGKIVLRLNDEEAAAAGETETGNCADPRINKPGDASADEPKSPSAKEE